MKEIVYIEVTTTDPAFNLALEEYVFEYLPRDKEYFLTWQNDNAIIVGRHQNTLAEINEEFVRSQGIRVVRRLSGGGAVYHDLGNLNFTFIVDAQPGQKVDLRKFCQPIADTLGKLGAAATVDGRNDILIDGKKISGNAQYVRQGRVMHHGTILFDADTSVLSKALQPDPTKVQAKGVKSVRSRVTNVRPCLERDMTLAEFRQTLTNSLLQQDGYGRYELTQQDIAAIEKIRQERYSRWEWNYGYCEENALVRKKRIENCGLVQAYISLDNGLVSGLTFRGDYFSTLPPEELAKRLIGLPLVAQSLSVALSDVRTEDYITGLGKEELIRLLCED